MKELSTTGRAASSARAAAAPPGRRPPDPARLRRLARGHASTPASPRTRQAPACLPERPRPADDRQAGTGRPCRNRNTRPQVQWMPGNAIAIRDRDRGVDGDGVSSIGRLLSRRAWSGEAWSSTASGCWQRVRGAGPTSSRRLETRRALWRRWRQHSGTTRDSPSRSSSGGPCSRTARSCRASSRSGPPARRLRKPRGCLIRSRRPCGRRGPGRRRNASAGGRLRPPDSPPRSA
jgi:hypothetical protein